MHHVIEDSRHGSLVCGPFIFKAKRHHSVIKVSDWGPKYCLSASLVAILIWLYPLYPSINENMEFPTVESTRRSMLGKGNSSFRHALFRLRKSTQY